MTNPTELKNLIARQRARQTRQMGIALLAGTALLALVAFLAPRAPEPTPAAVAEAPLPPAPDAYKDVSLVGKSAIVYDLATGDVLFERNAKAQLPLASLTKLLTMYAAMDTFSADTPIVITEKAVATDGESGFMVGETFRFKDLARIALVASSNDATEAIAEAAEAARGMTGPALLADAAKKAGLAQTYALNGTGLDESLSVSGGYGSAQDVARLAGALLEKAPELAQASTESSFSIYSTTGVLHTLPNTNPDVVHLPHVLLSKTGFTDLAGGNLVVVYDAGFGHPIAIVVLGSTREGRFSDVEELLDRTLAHFAGIAL